MPILIYTPTMANKKRLLFVVPELTVGGVSRSLLALLRGFPFERWEVSVLLFSKENALLDQLPPQVRVQYSAAMGQQEKLRGAVSSLLQRGPLRPLFRWAKGLYHRFGERLTARDSAIASYDVAVAYQDGMATWFVAQNIDASQKIAFIHTDFSLAGYDITREREVYQSFQRICFSSQTSSASFLTCLPEFVDKVTVVPNVIDPQEIQTLAAEGPGFIDDFNGLRLVTVGRLSHEKGVYKIPEIIQRLRPLNVSFRWYLIGDGPLMKTLERTAQAYPELILLGSHANPYPFVQQCDLYVQPSDYEGYCIALAEARSLYRPSVVCPFAGSHEQLHSGETGIITGFSAEELADTISQLFLQPTLRTQMISNLQSHAMQTNPVSFAWLEAP